MQIEGRHCWRDGYFMGWFIVFSDGRETGPHDTYEGALMAAIQ